MLAVGVDIGGTKTAVCLGRVEESGVTVLQRCTPRPTAGYTLEEMLVAIRGDILYLQTSHRDEKIERIGISCGGPLDSKRGVILSPPNLPGWDQVRITDYLAEHIGIPACLCNDANAGALAEWKYGAGRGCRSMAFLTFGTGLGAGLILNGRLYEGACGLAGEVGHIRLSADGPVGYGKSGSFEGYCSGGGIAQLARSYARREYAAGQRSVLCRDLAAVETLTAQNVGSAAKERDILALRILTEVGERLGEGLATLIDLLNPERIVIGSIFARCREEIWPAAQRVLLREALPAAVAACEVVPSELLESIGDIAALSVAAYYDASIS